MITINEVLDLNNLELAMEHLVSKRNSCGIDNIYVADFREYWSINSEAIIDKVRQGVYEPDIILEREIVGYNGKYRKISQMTCTDRFLLRAVNQILQPECETIFFDCSHAYREGYGTETAVRKASAYIAEG